MSSTSRIRGAAQSTDTTTIVADERVPAIRIERDFAASPAAVFRAHTDPDLVVRWLGPDDLVMTVDVWDCRPGGAYRYTHRRDDEAYTFRGCFHAVVPDRLIIQTFAYEAFPDSVALERLELVDLGDRRTRLVATGLVESFEARDAQLASGMEHGVRAGYLSLDALLAERQP